MLVRLVVFIGALCAASAVIAAEPVFPPGSRIGLIPPAGLAVSKTFEGFEDPDANVTIVFLDLPKRAYGDIEKGFSPEAQKARGIELESKHDVSLQNGHGFMVVAHQNLRGARIKEFTLVGLISDITVIVIAKMPEAAMVSYQDAIRGALLSIVTRAKPSSELLGLLPYNIKDLAGFQIVRATPNGAALLTDGTDDAIDLNAQSVFMINIGPAVSDQAEERRSFAQRAAAATPGVKDMLVERAEPIRIGGQPAEEMILRARESKTDAKLAVVQWLRFGSKDSMRLVGIAREDAWDKMLPRFQALRDGIEPK